MKRFLRLLLVKHIEKMEDLLFIALILMGIWYWWDTLQSNEKALLVCQQKCRAVGVQLLDATVTRQRTWLRRGGNGHLQICRLYGFEYDAPISTVQGNDLAGAAFGSRESGYIVLIAKQVVDANLPYENAVRHVN